MAEACKKLLWFEVGHVILLGALARVVCPSAEPSFIGSEEGMGSNLCLLMG